MTTADMKQLEEMIAGVKKAQAEYADFPQEKVDAIFRKAAIAANVARIGLAKMAVAETGMGIVEDKVTKNHFASEFIYNKYKDMKTCGVLERDETFGITKVAEPIGIIAGVVPTTNPTSTAIFKALISLKTRNGIIFSPHPRAKDCTREAAMLVRKAAEEAGAPAGLVECIEAPSVALSNALMGHPDIALILATGGPGMGTAEKIVFLADAIEPSRDYSAVDAIRAEASRDLDGAVLMTLDYTVKHLIKKGRVIDPRPILLRNELIRDGVSYSK